jgi:hypothetical protein
MLIETNISPYDLGYQQGYDDLQADCPFEEGTEEEEQFLAGYEEGSWNC